MDLQFISSQTTPCDTYLLPVFENEIESSLENSLIDENTQQLIFSALKREQFTAKSGSQLCLPTINDNMSNVFLLGLGKKDELKTGLASIRNAAIKSVDALKKCLSSNTLLHLTPSLCTACSKAIVEGLTLKTYSFDHYKSKAKDEDSPKDIQTLQILGDLGQDVQRDIEISHIQCLSTNWARHLANEPGNRLTPSILAQRAKTMADENELNCNILDEAQMEALGMGSLLSVSKGSEEEARLIAIEYKHPEAEKTIALVGKGLTFDAGGISLKPSAKMEQMRFDMCGSAAVLGTMHCLAQLKPKVNVVCVVPSSENLPDGKANKPGDVVTAMNGLNIEVDNTDAEGRLILADALAYTVKEYQPDQIVDLATLTGAVIMCFSHSHAAVLGNDDDLATELQSAGDQVHERLWPLPLLDEHKEWVKGRDADLNNTASGVDGAGTIKGAAFLSHFIGDTPWAHLDIAGTAWGPKAVEYCDGEHATGFGVRLLSQWLMEKYPN